MDRVSARFDGARLVITVIGLNAVSVRGVDRAAVGSVNGSAVRAVSTVVICRRIPARDAVSVGTGAIALIAVSLVCGIRISRGQGVGTLAINGIAPWRPVHVRALAISGIGCIARAIARAIVRTNRLAVCTGGEGHEKTARDDGS